MDNDRRLRYTRLLSPLLGAHSQSGSTNKHTFTGHERLSARRNFSSKGVAFRSFAAIAKDATREVRGEAFEREFHGEIGTDAWRLFGVLAAAGILFRRFAPPHLQPMQAWAERPLVVPVWVVGAAEAFHCFLCNRNKTNSSASQSFVKKKYIYIFSPVNTLDSLSFYFIFCQVNVYIKYEK